MGRLFEVVRDVTAEAWWELKRARLRTYLAVLGITVGAIGLTILICTLHLETALQGEQDATEISIRMPSLEDYSRTVFRRKPHLTRWRLTPEDGEAIQQECRDLAHISIRGWVHGADIRGKLWQQAPLLSTNLAQPDLFQYVIPYLTSPRNHSWELAWGRIFTPADMNEAARVVVIDQRMAMSLWPKPQRVLGNGWLGSRTIHINGNRFEVIGVLRSDRGPGIALIPTPTMQQLFWDADWVLSAIPKPGSARATARKVDEVLFARIGDPGYTYAILPGMSYEELKVYLFFGIVGCMVLLAAGAAVSNKAYIDALERVPQFAVRRALGATKQRLYAVVLTESALVCGFGCLYGGAIGWMIFASFSATKWILRGLGFALPVLPLGALFLCVIVLGVAGSLQGAAVAARANPAEILARKEVV